MRLPLGLFHSFSLSGAGLRSQAKADPSALFPLWNPCFVPPRSRFVPENIFFLVERPSFSCYVEATFRDLPARSAGRTLPDGYLSSSNHPLQLE
jgi:hypothetical protein